MYLTPSSQNKPDPTVKEVQNMLNAIRANYHHSWAYLIEDGVYGRDTASAVKKFQEYRGISATMTSEGVMLVDKTIEYIRSEYRTIPVLSNRSSTTTSINKKRSEDVNKSQITFDLISLLSNEGGPIYKKLEEAFPLAFKRLSARSDKPLFVFSKQMAYRNGAKYERFNLPESVSRYLGYIGLAWAWCAIVEDVKGYNQKRLAHNNTHGDTLKLGANIFSLCTSSIDTILSLPATKQLATKMAGRYAVAETGAAFSVAGASSMSTIGACIGAFLLGWEIGKLIGDIPIGDGKCIQDVIDDFIYQAWEHPYKTLGASPIALAIDGWKKIVDWNVNRVSNLKPLTLAEKQKLDQYLMQHREMTMYAAPPKYVMPTKR